MRAAEAGLALPAALWLAAMVSVIGAGALMIAGADLRRSVSASEQAQARHWAEGVASLAALRLAEADPLYRDALKSGQPLELQHREGAATVVMSREKDRLDLNAAEPVEIAALLLELGYARDKAEQLAGAIADFRDADDLTRLGGAEADAYQAAGLSHVPLNRPFLNFAEVGLVLGVQPNDLKALEQRATIWRGRPGAALIEDLDRKAASGQSDGGALFWGGAFSWPNADEADELGGDALRITVDAVAASGATSRVVWIVLVDRGRVPPFRVLDRP